MAGAVNFVWARRGSLIVVVQNKLDPTNAEWDPYVEATAAALREHEGWCRVLVFTAGGKPDSEQRARILDRGWRDNHRSPVVVVTNDPLARGVITVFSWFGLNIRAFREGQLDQALAWLELSDTERRWLSVERRILEERLKL